VIKRIRINETVTCSSFTTPEGTDEFYIVCETGESGLFEKALAKLDRNYFEAMAKLGLCAETLVFCRFYVSDLANQKNALRLSEIYAALQSGAISVIQQPPSSCDGTVLLAYHVKNKNGRFGKSPDKKDLDPWRSGITVRGHHYSLTWTANFSKPGDMDSKKQTNDLWRLYCAYAAEKSLTIRSNLVRTWIYVRDIDNNYQGMVEARRDFFSTQGLTAKTRFVASTGIEGKAMDPRTVVSMDCLAIGGITEEQIFAMNASENMSPAMDYGVTFERGLRIKFRDRSHLHISGTASIDRAGKILHGGNVEKQAFQTLDNIEALLKNQGASLADLSHVLCYVRDLKDYATIAAVINERLAKDLPIVSVHGPVCRPGWLVEMEGIAIMPDKSRFAPFF
jgi:enamine deaminase RidA (YjgF/YER057c/UK114 family)